MTDQTISVVASARGVEELDDYLGGPANRGPIDDLKKFFTARVDIPADDMAIRISAFLNKMDGVLGKIPGVLGGFEIEEMELKIEISAKGEVSLLGTGGEIGATGGLSFKLKRKK